MRYLKAYNVKELGGFFTDGRTIYELHIENKYFFGMISEKAVIEYPVSFEADDEVYTNHWDKLIKTQEPIGIRFFDHAASVLILACLFIILRFLYLLIK